MWHVELPGGHLLLGNDTVCDVDTEKCPIEGNS